MSDTGVPEEDSPTPVIDLNATTPKGRSNFAILKLLLGIIGVTIIIFLGWTFSRQTSVSDFKGTVALSEKALRELVLTNHLTTYWAGPEANYMYTLTVPQSGISIVKYLPQGIGVNDPAPNYRVIATYLQKNAYQAMNSASRSANSVFFTNIDGSSAFYLKDKSTHVYLAPQSNDAQIEIFDPAQDQALALALFKGKIRKIE